MAAPAAPPQDGGAASAAEFTIKAIMGLGKGVLDEAAIDAANTVNEANVYASNLVRAANNRLGAARGSLARYTQSVNNQRVLDNTGSAMEAATINYRRARDSAAASDFEQQLAFAEQAGAQTAAAAFSGLSGGVADLVAGTTALRRARLKQRSDEAEKQGDWDMAQRTKQIMQAGWDSLDSSEISDNIDYNTDVAVKQVRAGNIFSDILGGQDTKTMANLAATGKSFFKSKPNSYEVDSQVETANL